GDGTDGRESAADPGAAAPQRGAAAPEPGAADAGPAADPAAAGHAGPAAAAAGAAAAAAGAAATAAGAAATAAGAAALGGSECCQSPVRGLVGGTEPANRPSGNGIALPQPARVQFTPAGFHPCFRPDNFVLPITPRR